MEIDRLFREADVVATDVAKLETSPFYLWCHCFAPDDARDPPSDYMQMLAERGDRHEREVVDEEFPDLEEFRPETTEEVIEKMREGVAAFDNVPLFSEDRSFAGKPDLLEKRNSHGSKFGDFHYVVKEIKTVKRPAEHKEYVLQAAFYNYLLGELQGYTPEEFYLVNRDGEETAFRFDNYKDRLFEALEEAQRIKNGEERPSPTLDTPYPWEGYSKEKAWEENDVSLINGVGSSTKQRLQQHGFETVEDVYEASIDELTGVHRVGRKTARKSPKKTSTTT